MVESLDRLAISKLRHVRLCNNGGFVLPISPISDHDLEFTGNRMRYKNSSQKFVPPNYVADDLATPS